MNDGRKIKLSTLVVDGERTFQYLYDYGDGWCCVVVLETVAPIRPAVAYPRLVEGARRRGPPEDIGGPWGYGDFLEAIADPKHERHKELLEWCGGFDPQQFDVDEINRRLASLAPHKSTRRKTAKPAAQ